MSCIFCDATPEEGAGPHHILPKNVRRAMGWNGKRASMMLNQYKVPLCMDCHRKVNKLLEPLTQIIKYLRGNIRVPIEFAYLMDGVYTELIQHSELPANHEEGKE